MEITQIDCPCCGKKVSLQAKACPQCGHPIATTQVESPQRVADPYAKEVYEDIMTHRIIELICGIISIIVIIILFQQCSKWFNDVDKISTVYSAMATQEERPGESMAATFTKFFIVLLSSIMKS